MVMRRMMMSSKDDTNVPLYPYSPFTYSPSNAVWRFQADSHISATTSANSKTVYAGNIVGNRSTAHSTSWPVWFTLLAGDEWELKIKNITYTASTNANNYCNVYLYTTDGTSAIGSNQISFGSGEGTTNDLTFTGTMTADKSINAIRFTIYRSVNPLEFDIEFWVNGQRYF